MLMKAAVGCSCWRRKMRLLLGLLFVRVVVSTFNFTEIRNAEYCERQMFRADCGADDKVKDKVVVMVAAKYGRSTRPTSKCGGISASDCDIDIIDLFDRWCSGRRSCEVRVSHIIDNITDNQMLSCLRDFRGFLEASYACVPVIMRTQAECIGRRASVQLTDHTGYLANVVTDESGCGSLESPWILEAPAGQTIHLRLIDFAFSLHDTTYPRKSCDVYLIVKEKPFSVGNTICSIDQKEQNVFVSESNKIEVRIGAQSSFRGKDQELKKKYFLLKYTLQGCPDIPGGNGRWVERIGAVSVVGCNGTNEKYQLTCQFNSWVGEIPECLPSNWGGSSSSLFWSVFTDSQWIAIVTILGIALIIGVIIFLAGIICIRKRRQVQSYGSQVCASPRCMAEYHLARCDPAAYARHGSATPKSLSLDLLGGASLDGSNVENDYFRTWQLQRNAFNNMRCPNIPPSTDGHLIHPHFVPSSMAYKPIAMPGQIDQDNDGIDFDGFRKQTLPLVEHIYESPKFDRKDYTMESYATSNPQTIQNSDVTFQDDKITEETMCPQKS